VTTEYRVESRVTGYGVLFEYNRASKYGTKRSIMMVTMMTMIIDDDDNAPAIMMGRMEEIEMSDKLNAGDEK
jgi:hypothetical protein